MFGRYVGQAIQKARASKTLENLEARAFVFEFVGEIVNNEELVRQLDMRLVERR
jgi:hypothetical protein